MTGMTTPKLRFPGFQDPWKPTAVSALLERQSVPVDVDPTQTYRQIGVRSHGKGIFHKDAVTGSELGDKRVFQVVPDALVVNIVFAWEQAVALTSDAEAGFVASHRFPMFTAKYGKSYLPFLRQMFLTKRGKILLEMASPGGAGRNKTLGQQEFLKLKPVVPSQAEQKKIADAFGAVDAKLTALAAKQIAIRRFKIGLMQQLFHQKIRLTKANGQAFPDWQEIRLGNILRVKKLRNREGRFHRNDVLSVSGEFGIVNQIEHLGRSYAGESLDNYHIVETGDIVYTKSPLKSNPYGIIKVNKGKPGIVSTLYAVYEVREGYSGDFIDRYFELDDNLNRYLEPLVHKGAKNDMKISSERVLIDPITVPCIEEQRKIADALSALDAKIQALTDQVTKLQTFKKGLLQQMFV